MFSPLRGRTAHCPDWRVQYKNTENTWYTLIYRYNNILCNIVYTLIVYGVYTYMIGIAETGQKDGATANGYRHR